jgi:hypothetical protein
MKTAEELQKEITRVKTALQKTQSPYLKRDYEKYLKRLLKQQKAI